MGNSLSCGKSPCGHRPGFSSDFRCAFQVPASTGVLMGSPCWGAEARAHQPPWEPCGPRACRRLAPGTVPSARMPSSLLLNLCKWWPCSVKLLQQVRGSRVANKSQVKIQ